MLSDGEEHIGLEIPILRSDLGLRRSAQVHVLTFDRETGAEQDCTRLGEPWRNPMADRGYTLPADGERVRVDEGITAVLHGANQDPATITALDLTAGDVVWEAEIPGIPRLDLVHTAAAIPGELLMVSPYGINSAAYSGSYVDLISETGPASLSPASREGHEELGIYALDTETGEQLWQYPEDENTFALLVETVPEALDGEGGILVAEPQEDDYLLMRWTGAGVILERNGT